MQPPTKRKSYISVGIIVLALGVAAVATFLEWRHENSKEGVEKRVSKMFEASMQAGAKPDVNMNTTGNGIWTGTVRYEGGIVYRVTLDASKSDQLEWERDGKRGTLLMFSVP